MSRRDQHDQQPLDPQHVASTLLAVVIAILVTLALVHWMGCSQADGASLCSAVITPLRTGRWAWLSRLIATLRAAGLRKELEWQESALDNMEAVARDLPEEIRHQRSRVDALRIQQIDAATAARGDA